MLFTSDSARYGYCVVMNLQVIGIGTGLGTAATTTMPGYQQARFSARQIKNLDVTEKKS